ncbi:hypothetical protein [Hymenobacter sp.]|uniref:hypothetical protein n=1 Tax=Hymenobacter sp. TaxID=1898978 RepID=UPI00286CA919|nr:hypothetical protein [Hymenobacter sp.]
MEGARRALVRGVTFNIAGGTHHTFRARGKGFCLLDGQAAAIWLLAHGPAVRQVLIVDLDVHQGNGTAAIIRAGPRVFTFSCTAPATTPPAKKRRTWTWLCPTAPTLPHTSGS